MKEYVKPYEMLAQQKEFPLLLMQILQGKSTHICISFILYAIQVGGLGDVVTSLSRAIQDLNHNVDIVLPKYDCLNLSNVSFIPN